MNQIQPEHNSDATQATANAGSAHSIDAEFYEDIGILDTPLAPPGAEDIDSEDLVDGAPMDDDGGEDDEHLPDHIIDLDNLEASEEESEFVSDWDEYLEEYAMNIKARRLNAQGESQFY